MKRIVADGKSEFAFFRQMRSRSTEIDEKVTATVREIIGQVRARGDEAVKEYP